MNTEQAPLIPASQPGRRRGLRRRSSSPLATLAAVGLVATLGLTGCGNGNSWRGGTAATFGDTTITADDLLADVRALAPQRSFAQVWLQTDLTDVKLDDDVALPTKVFTAALNQRISNLLVAEELAQRGVTIGQPELTSASAELDYLLGELQQDAAQQGGGAAVLDDFHKLPEETRARVIRTQAANTVLRTKLAADADPNFPLTVQAWFDAHRTDYDQQCLSIIAAEDEAKATTLRKQVESGRTFASVAKESSLDTDTGANGGDAGCAALAQLPDTVRAPVQKASLNSVIGPLNINETFYLVTVTRRTPASFDSARRLATQDWQSAGTQAFTAWRSQQTPRVTVDPRYGTWDPKRLIVTAPVPAGSTTATVGP